MTTCWKKNLLKILAVICVLISCILAISIYSFSVSSKGSSSSNSKSRSSDINSNSASTINSIDNNLNRNNNLNKTNFNLKDNNLFSISSTTTTTTTLKPLLSSTSNIIIPPINYDDQSSSSSETTSPSTSTSSADIDLLTPELNNFATQFVKPSKIHVQPLHDDDLLYESRKNYWNDSPEEQYQHITGHFRNKSSKIWDPHPQYEIDVFGLHLHLILYQDSGFIPKDIKITHVWPNETLRVKDDHRDFAKLKGCFYKGHVRGDEKSSVSVSLCDGMMGHIRTSTGSFFIKPVEKYTNENSNILHAVYRVPSPEFKRHDDVTNKNDQCATASSTENIDRDDFHVRNGDGTSGVHVRRKRNIPSAANNEYTMEVLVAVDLSMQKYHKDSINSYVLTLMSIVSSIYADASIGNSINIAVVHILLLKHKFNLGGAHGSGVSASSMLDEFCRLKRHYTSHYHHDTALLITREQICRNPNQMKCDTLGLAELGTMCKSYSCAIAQDNGLSAAFTIAHELGHVLNMPHDDDSKCQPFTSEEKSQHIMSRMLDHNTHPWSWSKCSRYFVTEFLEKDHGKCMLNKPEHDMIEPQWPNSQLAGEKFTDDKQCELVFGPRSRICSYMPVCNRLWCSQDNNEQEGCRTQHMPWADGTTCDNDKWCQKGQCVERNRTALKPIDGGWGGWRSYGSCSRSCGGGIQTRTRDCNIPAPSNGGKYCIGPRIMYRSCNKENCAPNTHDFREEQCREFNGNNFDIQGLESDVKWIPKYGVTSTDECKLFCRVYKTSNYFLLKDKVVDGTPCTHDSFNKCVNGMCRKAGCDNELNSEAIIDKCGVCNGRNTTCVDVEGSFRTSQIISQQTGDIKGIYYFDIMSIPAGASNIIIEQPGSENDNNYIALKDDAGQYLLNGKNLITQFPKTFPYAAVTFSYNGANSSIERVNTTFAISIQRNLTIQILSLRPMNLRNNAELLRFSYSLSKNHSEPDLNDAAMVLQHQWQMSDWSNCDKSCMGTTFKTAHCVERVSGQTVPTEYCNKEDKPEDEYKTCKSDCTAGWDLNRSECSNICGDGERTLMYQCVLRFIRSSNTKVVEDSECSSIPKPATVHEPCYGTCDYATWSYGDWEPCSHTCGGGAQNRILTCLSSNVGYPVDKQFCNHLSHDITIRSCNSEPCPEWAYGEESPCSVTCGEGTYTTAIVCKENNNLVNAALCQNNTRLKPIMKKCTMGPCRKKYIEKFSKDGTPVMNFVNPITSVTRKYDSYTPDYRVHQQKTDNSLQFERYDWKTGPWSECSITCGIGGLRKRSVICASMLQMVDDSYCTTVKPIDNLKCGEKIPCPEWNYSEWSECDSQCKRHRQVGCQNQTTRFDREMCDAATEPSGTETCCRYRWKIEFGPCSSRCGTGYRMGERIKCVLIKPKSKTNKHPVKNAPKLDDRYCSHLKKPAFLKRKKACKITCPTATWTTSGWTTCPAGCGTGLQLRNVTCMANGKVVSPKECDLKRKPSKTQSCDSTRHCHWRTTPWRDCNCNGFRKRRVDCIDQLIGKESNRCDDRHRPRNSEKCIAPKTCSCKQIKEVTNARRDGEYKLFIKGKNVSVYCYNMSSANPLEYVTLKAGLYQNHASYSKKRSNNPSMCPTSRSDEMDEPSSQYGKTIFYKIRILLQSLRVVENDFTFAESEGIPQMYGTAGDCYSKAERCPQGIFTINLEGTGFKLRKTTRWDTKGTNATIIYLEKFKAPFKKISARCGGYCGSCFPSKSTSLHLDVSG